MTAEMIVEEIALTTRRETTDRRAKPERRQKVEKTEVDRREPIRERRQKVERRRQIDPTTCERDYTDADIEFMTAIDRYRRENGRPFPTWSEVLEVVLSLGYVKIQKPTDSPPLVTGV